MRKLFINIVFALLGLVMFAFTAQAQTPPATPPPGTPYITMTVTNNATVRIHMRAAEANTTVWIETAPNTYTPVTVGTNSTNGSYTANGTTIKVHGNLKGFISGVNYSRLTGLTFSSGLTNLEHLNCSGNSLTTLDVSGLTNLEHLNCSVNSLTTLDVSGLTNLEILDCSSNPFTTLDVSELTNLKYLACDNNSLTTLDVSRLTNLKKLWCYSNNFSFQAINDIYCALPQRDTADNAVIYPLFDKNSADYNTVRATSRLNATQKNWKVRYAQSDTDISTWGSYVCPLATPPAGTPYITMTVTNNATVQIDLMAAEDNTPVWVETASNTYTKVTVGTSWTGFVNYTATGTTIKVHGNLQGFDCKNNGNKITGLTFSSGLTNLEGLHCFNNSLTVLDVSRLTSLKYLSCHGNNFSTQAIDDIYCGLPQRLPADNATIQPVYNSSSTNHATVLATNKQNAIAKNWKVQYYSNDTDIPETSGGWTCPPPTPPANTPYITMTVTENATVDIGMQVAADGTTVWVESAQGSYTPVTVGTDGTLDSYTATDTTIKIYGNLKGFNCGENGSKLTGLTFSSGLNSLELLICSDNSLTTLDVSGLTNLKSLFCGNNNFSTQAIDNIYCGLPQRETSDNANICPVENSSSANHAIVLATNKQNAINKSWNVKYSEDGTDIPATLGKYVCGTGIDDVTTAEQLSIYPNPAKELVTVELNESYTGLLQITDISGKTLISHKINGTHASVDISTLSKGIYFVKIGSKVEKLVKQ